MATGGAGGMTTGGTGGSSADCASAILAIKAQMVGVLACTSVVRLDYQTRAIKGVRFLCGAYRQLPEKTKLEHRTGINGSVL